MQPPLMPRMSPVEERRDHVAKVKREGMLQRHLRACVALIDVIDSGAIATEGSGMTARQIQQQFHLYEDRVLSRVIMGEVLAQVRVLPEASHRLIQQWQVVEAKDDLETLSSQLRTELGRVRRQLGRE